MSQPQQDNTHSALLQCQVCGECVVAKFTDGRFAGWNKGVYIGLRLEPVEVWPQEVAPEAPQHAPGNVRSYFLQGLDNLQRRNFDAAGTMFRKSLDIALKRLCSVERLTPDRRGA
ncbi:hypothetical protein GCM10009416_49390 [Craurococcus roseus]|uniref:Uncharacterized protein n=1 Tax=Craurococcus roseus TaxID=77585 RepID=A0ABP3RFL0_9PROT